MHVRIQHSDTGTERWHSYVDNLSERAGVISRKPWTGKRTEDNRLVDESKRRCLVDRPESKRRTGSLSTEKRFSSNRAPKSRVPECQIYRVYRVSALRSACPFRFLRAVTKSAKPLPTHTHARIAASQKPTIHAIPPLAFAAKASLNIRETCAIWRYSDHAKTRYFR